MELKPAERGKILGSPTRGEECLLHEKQKLEAMLEGKGITVERFIATCVGALKKSTDLCKCDQDSFVTAAFACAEMGLEPNTKRDHCYFVARGEKGKQNKQVKVDMGYKGFAELLYRSGKVSTIDCYAVKSADDFKVYMGTKREIHHEPAFRPEDETTHVYSVVGMGDGQTSFEVMTREEVEQVRLKSKMPTYGPWKEFYDQMAKKSVLRRHANRLPLGTNAPELETAFRLDNEAHTFEGPAELEAPSMPEGTTADVAADMGEVF